MLVASAARKSVRKSEFNLRPTSNISQRFVCQIVWKKHKSVFSVYIYVKQYSFPSSRFGQTEFRAVRAIFRWKKSKNENENDNNNNEPKRESEPIII